MIDFNKTPPFAEIDKTRDGIVVMDHYTNRDHFDVVYKNSLTYLLVLLAYFALTSSLEGSVWYPVNDQYLCDGSLEYLSNETVHLGWR